MPEAIEDYYARVLAAADAEQRIALDSAGIPTWDIFPFEPEGLRLKPLAPLADDETPRNGEDPAQCWCVRGRPTDNQVWEDDRWFLESISSGAPLVMLLTPRAHHDLTDLPDDLASELGRLLVAVGASIETLPSVARVHVSKWGDGGAHLHVFFFARPTRMPQLLGTCLALWDDFLPPVPDDVRSENAQAVVSELVRRYGGRATEAVA